MDGLTAISLCVPVCLILCVLGSLFVSGAFTAASAEIGRAVPPSTFSDYEQPFSRIIRGERDILTADPPTFFNISSGTTGESKYIPLCREDVEKQHLYADRAIPGIIREALPQYSERELFGCIFHLCEFFLTDTPDGSMSGVRSSVSLRTAYEEGSLDCSCYTAPEAVLFPDRM